MKKYNKLVRDLIPDVLEEKGGEYFLKRVESDREYFYHLRNKLVEEVAKQIEKADITTPIAFPLR